MKGEKGQLFFFFLFISVAPGVAVDSSYQVLPTLLELDSLGPARVPASGRCFLLKALNIRSAGSTLPHFLSSSF